jgi:hypothetical protein
VTLEAIDYFRGFDILLALACFVLLCTRLMAVWKKMSTAQQVLFSSILCFMVYSAWESLEMIVDNEPVAYRIILRTVALILMLVYLLEPRPRYIDRMGHDPLSGEDFKTKRGTPDATL